MIRVVDEDPEWAAGEAAALSERIGMGRPVEPGVDPGECGAALVRWRGERTARVPAGWLPVVLAGPSERVDDPGLVVVREPVDPGELLAILGLAERAAEAQREDLVALRAADAVHRALRWLDSNGADALLQAVRELSTGWDRCAVASTRRGVVASGAGGSVARSELRPLPPIEGGYPEGTVRRHLAEQGSAGLSDLAVVTAFCRGEWVALGRQGSPHRSDPAYAELLAWGLAAR